MRESEKGALIGLALVGGLLAYSGRSLASDLMTEASQAFTRWDPLIREASRKHGVPWRWIKAVMWNESSLGRARSVVVGLSNPSDHAGSASFDGKSWGLMQVTLTTAREMRPGTTIEDLNNPRISIDLGAQYLSRMIRIFGLDREKVARAYNGGPGYARTAKGPAMTAEYYAKFKRHLEAILERQPGPETEIG